MIGRIGEIYQVEVEGTNSSRATSTEQLEICCLYSVLSAGKQQPFIGSYKTNN